MPNFSHGTAGIAYFLATLYEETKDRAFLDAALAGARYLQAIAKTDGDRCLDLPPRAGSGRQDLYYLGWCHGPAGTARLCYRLRRSPATGMDGVGPQVGARHRRRAACPNSRRPASGTTSGQCCGSAGVAEFFLPTTSVTGDAATSPSRGA